MITFEIKMPKEKRIGANAFLFVARIHSIRREYLRLQKFALHNN